MRVFARVLSAYAKTATAVRLEPLRFCWFGDDEALVIGVPGLPLPGDRFWRKPQRTGDVYMPLGYDLNMPEELGLKEVAARQAHWWFADGRRVAFSVEEFETLSRSNASRLPNRPAS